MKKILKWVFAGVLVIFLIHAGYIFTYGRWIDYKEVTIKSDKVTSDSSGMRVAFVTDTHSLSIAATEKLVMALNRRDIDMLVLGGDFATYHKTHDLMRILARVRTTYGIYSVIGNHDDPRNLARACADNGILLLINAGLHVQGGLYLAGVSDLRHGDADVAKALSGSDKNDFVLLLAHNPDITMIRDVSGADLTLSGHTHGGQVTFFGLWAPALTMRKTITAYGQRFMGGFAKSAAGTDVYVSSGTGQLKYIPRLFSRPEVTIFTLVND